MEFYTFEHRVKQAGGVATALTLAAIFQGLRRGHKQPRALTNGHFASWLRSPLFYLLSSVGYFGFCWRLWRPFPWMFVRPLRAVFLFLGTLFYFPGLALVLWGRLELGHMYDVSSSFGAQLYARHRLFTSGPFAYVRHPMYIGILLTALGGLLLYRTWTFLFLLAHVPVLLFALTTRSGRLPLPLVQSGNATANGFRGGYRAPASPIAYLMPARKFADSYTGWPVRR